MTFVLSRLGSAELRNTARSWVPGLVLIAATLLPLGRDPREDSFPLSTYPMFARPRSDVRVLTVQYVTPEGESLITPTRHLGTSEVLQAARLIRAAWRAGKPEAQRLLQDTSRRLAGAGIVHRELRLVEVVYEPIAYFSEAGASPKQQQVLMAWTGANAPGASGAERP